MYLYLILQFQFKNTTFVLDTQEKRNQNIVRIVVSTVIPSRCKSESLFYFACKTETFQKFENQCKELRLSTVAQRIQKREVDSEKLIFSVARKCPNILFVFFFKTAKAQNNYLFIQLKVNLQDEEMRVTFYQTFSVCFQSSPLILFVCPRVQLFPTQHHVNAHSMKWVTVREKTT